MKKAKRFLFWYAGAFLVAMMALPALNFFVDSSRVLTRDYGHHYKNRQGNINFLKVAYLLEHAADYDSLIFGSSRVRYGFDPRQMNRTLGGKWYKMEYPGGVPSDHLYNLRLLIEKGFVPKSVILTLDDFDLYRDRTPRVHDYFYRPYPKTFLDWIDFYQFYLFKKPTSKDWEFFFGKVPLKETERILRPFGFSRNEESSAKAHERKMLALRPQGWHYGLSSEHRMAFLLDDIRAFVDLCRQHQIRLSIMITPRHYKALISRDFNLLAQFKQSLAEIHPYVDFAVLDGPNTDNSNWHDASHFYTNVGRMVVSRLKHPATQPGRFGVLVTKRNVEMHVKKVKENVLRHLARFMEYDHQIIVHPSLLMAKNRLDGGLEAHIRRIRGMRLNKRKGGGYWLQVLDRRNALVIADSVHDRSWGRAQVLRIRLRSPVRVKRGIVVLVKGNKSSSARYLWDVHGGANEYSILVTGNPQGGGVTFRLTFKSGRRYLLELLELRDISPQGKRQETAVLTAME